VSNQRIFERFIHKAPFAVMTRLVADAFIADELDEVFEQHRERQYTRDVKFSAIAASVAQETCKVQIRKVSRPLRQVNSNAETAE